MNYSLTRPLSSHTSGRNPRVLRCWRRRTGHSVAALICFTLNESVNKRNVAVHVCEIAHLPLCPQDLSSRPPQREERYAHIHCPEAFFCFISPVADTKLRRAGKVKYLMPFWWKQLGGKCCSREKVEFSAFTCILEQHWQHSSRDRSPSRVTAVVHEYWVMSI